MGNYVTVDKISNGEYSEKRSRFIATLYPCKSEEEAARILADHRAKYWDARHNVYAYILKDNTAKFSDDGEPHSTAGKPVYDCLSHSGIVDAIMVVTRYFGGVLLGTGGLVRAYSAAAKQAIENASLVTMANCDIFEVVISYGEQGKIMPFLRDSECDIIDTEFGENVKITFAAVTENSEKVLSGLREISGDKLSPKKTETRILPVNIKK